MPAKRKGLSLEELEEQEGGPVKESQVGLAQTKRAKTRKTRHAGNSPAPACRAAGQWHRVLARLLAHQLPPALSKTA